MRKRSRWVRRARRARYWPICQVRAGLHLADPPEPAGPLRRRLPGRDVVPLRLVVPEEVPPALAPMALRRPRLEPQHDGIGERRANVEATLGLLLVILVCVGIARADDVRRLPDRALGVVERRLAALHELRTGLDGAYLELVWRVHDRRLLNP